MLQSGASQVVERLLTFDYFRDFDRYIIERIYFFLFIGDYSYVFLVDFIFHAGERTSYTIFAVGTNRFHFGIIAGTRGRDNVFGTIAKDFEDTRMAFGTVDRLCNYTFHIGYDCFAICSYTFLIRYGPIIRQVFYGLFGTRKSALALYIGLRGGNYSFVTFLMFAGNFFTYGIPKSIERIGRTISTTIRTSRSARIDSELSFAFGAITLIINFHRLLPQIKFTLLRARKSAAAFFISVRGRRFRGITGIGGFKQISIFINPIRFKGIGRTFGTFFSFGRTTMINRINCAANRFNTFQMALDSDGPQVFTRLFRTRKSANAFTIRLRRFGNSFITGIGSFTQVLGTFPNRVNSIRRTIGTARVGRYAMIDRILGSAFGFRTFLRIFRRLVTLYTIFKFSRNAAEGGGIITLLVRLSCFRFGLFTFRIRHITRQAGICREA